MKRVLKIVFYGNILLVLLTLLAYLSPYINPSEIYFFSFFGLLFPFLLFLNLLAICFWLFIDTKRALLSLVIIVLGWSSVQRCISLDFQSAKKNTKDNISIAAFNCHNALYTIQDRVKNQEKEEEYLKFLAPFNEFDIICFQESGLYSDRLYDKVFSFPHKFSIAEKKNRILSRFPIIDGGNIEFGTYTNSCIWIDLDLGKDTIRIYSIHLQSNKISGKAEEVVGDDYEQSKAWTDTKSILGRYKNYAAVRVEQVEKILKHKSSSPYPVIIAGDVNDSPQSYIYKTLSNSMKDSFVERGIGQGATYAGVIPGLRIDYIFGDSDFSVLSHRVIREKFSDHYPVHSFLQLK